MKVKSRELVQLAGRAVEGLADEHEEARGGRVREGAVGFKLEWRRRVSRESGRKEGKMKKSQQKVS